MRADCGDCRRFLTSGTIVRTARDLLGAGYDRGHHAVVARYLLKEFGFAAQAFSSAEEFLVSRYLKETKCLILDVAMPGLSGPDLQQELARRRQEIPIVFITAHRDERVRPRLLEQGAVECLFKPFSEADLLEALNAAFRLS